MEFHVKQRSEHRTRRMTVSLQARPVPADPRNRFGARLVALLGVSCFSLAACAPAREAAELVPAGAIAFVGWDQCLDPGAASTAKTREMLSKLIERLAEPDDQDAKTAQRIINALLEAGTATGAIALLDVPAAAGDVQPEAALIIAGLSAPEQMVALMKQLHDEDEKPSSPVQLGDAALSTVCPPDSDHKLYYGVYRKHFLAVFGEKAAKDVLAVLRGEGQSLAASPPYLESSKSIARYAPNEKLVAFVNIERAVATARAVAVAEGEELPPNFDSILNEVGIAAMHSLHWRHGSAGDRAGGVLHLRTQPGASNGLLKVLRQKPVDRDLLALAPSDSYWTCASSLDLHEFWNEAMRILNAIAPEAGGPVGGAVASARQFLGFSVTDDLLPNLGKDWLFFDAPNHGGFLFTGIVMVLRPADPAALHGMISRMGELITPLLSQAKAELRQVETKLSNRTIHTWLGAGLPIPVAPSWTQIESRTAFALFPQTLATMLKRIDPKTRHDDLIKDKQFVEALEGWPKDLTGIGFINAKAVTRMGYPLWALVQTAICSLSHEAGKSIDLEAFPPLPELLETVRCAASATWHDPEGIYFAYGGGTSVVAQVLYSPLAAIALGASVLLPALADGREQAQRTASIVNLRKVGLACHEYRHEHADQFPPDLQTLVNDGKLMARQLQLPRGTRGSEEYVYIAGQQTASPLTNALAYEGAMSEDGAYGDDTVVLFVDGHVETVSHDRLGEILRQTYGNLKRLNDLPAEFQSTRPPSESPE